jgi:hypothetical protein
VKRRYSKAVGMKIVSHIEFRKCVDELLLDDQSPEMTSEHIRKYRKELPYISLSALRRYIENPYGRRIESKREKYAI